MKLLKLAICLLLLGGISASCTKEDHTDCYNTYRLDLCYYGDGNDDIFSKKITSVDMYVFDVNSNCISSKKLSKELKLTYLNDWQLFHEMGMSKVPNSKIFSKIMAEFLRDKQKVVLDADMSIMPKDYIKCGFDSKVYYLGFVSVDKNTLAQKLFAGDTPNMSLAKRKAKYLIKCGKTLFKQCKKYNLPFFEIKEDSSRLRRPVEENTTGTY